MRNIGNGARDLILRFRHELAIVLQVLLVVVSNRIAFQLRFDGDVPAWALVAFWQMLPWLVAIRALTFFPLGLYEGLWRYSSFYDLQSLAGAVTASSLLFYLAHVPARPAHVSTLDLHHGCRRARAAARRRAHGPPAVRGVLVEPARQAGAHLWSRRRRRDGRPRHEDQPPVSLLPCRLRR